MATMICANCERYGIQWFGLSGPSPHTHCPHCGGIDCQVPEEPDELSALDQEREDALSDDANRCCAVITVDELADILGDDAAFFDGEDVGDR